MRDWLLFAILIQIFVLGLTVSDMAEKKLEAAVRETSCPCVCASPSEP